MTNKSIDSQRLAVALRKKFGTPRALLRALGLDETLLTSSPGRLALDARGNKFGRDQVENLNGSAPTGGSAAHQLRAAIEAALKDHEDLPQGLTKALLEAAEKYAPLDAAGDEEPDDRRAELAELARREQHGPEALDCESAAEFLRSKGVDEETIKSAVGMVRDSFPPNALPNGGGLGRGLGVGARFAAKRAAGMDSAVRKFGLDRIETWGAADQAVDSRPVPSAARLGRMFDRFPGLANIGVYGG